MKNIIIIFLSILFIAGCNRGSDNDKQLHEHNDHSHDVNEQGEETIHDHDGTNGNHTEPESDHQDEDTRILITAYSNHLELFAEADPFINNRSSGILAHFTLLPSFDPLEERKITATLKMAGSQEIQSSGEALRTGIYQFSLKPEAAGNGTLTFRITTDTGQYKIVTGIRVFNKEHEALHHAEEEEVSSANAIIFTKEQSWKVEFATSVPVIKPFGQVIKTTAQVRPVPENEILITAKSSGIVNLPEKDLLEGIKVNYGDYLLTITGEGLVENNPEIRFVEAENNYKKARKDYERAKDLAEDQIITEKELLAAEKEYKNANAVFKNLQENFSSRGLIVNSPMNGYIREVNISNGEHVVTGQRLMSIFSENELLLHAEVERKFSSILDKIKTANIRTMHNKSTYTLEELNGRIVSYGRTVNNKNYLIPLNIRVNNNADLLPGEFVEIYLQAITDSNAITLPNSALLEEHGNYFVFVQLTPELFEKREVKTGATDGMRTEIKDGISPDQRVVTKGAMIVKLASSTGTLDAHSGHVH